MATPVLQFDAVPDAPVFDAIPDDQQFDAVPDEVIAQEAQRASTGALQAIDVMNAPARLDWSEVNEHLDAQRLEESRAALARAEAAEQQGSGTGPGSEAFNWRREADFQRGRISPDTAAGRTLAQEGQAQLREIQEVGATDEQNASRTPSQAISGILGPGLSPTVMPVVEATGRHLGSSSGGALTAALATAATGGTGGIASLLFGTGMSMLGSMVGGTVQEEVLQTTESDEQTQLRHERDIQAAAQNPGANLAGGLLATRPFFGPSIAQFGRAAAGDRGALMNIGMAGSIGAGAEVIGAAMRGETAKAKDVAAAFFSNAVMNEPTKLGRKLGLRPSSEQQAIEDAQARYAEGVPPIGERPQLERDLGTRGTTSTADVFAGVPRRTAPTGEASLSSLKTRTEIDSELTRIWPEVENYKRNAISGEWTDTVRKKYEALSADRKAVVDAFFDQNQETISRMEDGEWFALRSERLQRIQNPQEFGAELADAIKEIDSRFPFSKRKAAALDMIQEAGQIARGSGLDTSQIEAGVRGEFQKTFGADADEMLATYLLKREATPIETTPISEAQAEQPTSIQNAVTAEERAARGIDPVEEPARRAFGEVWDTVKTEIAENPTSPDALLAELRQKPRALTDREDALILHKQIELQKSFDAAAAEVNRAAEAGDEPARVDAMARLDRTRDALQDVYTIGKQAGTETARGLQARKMMADQEFTLAAMETRLRAEQGGALTPEQQAQVKQQADTIVKTQEGMDRILAEREVAKAQATEDAKVDPKVKSLADRIIARLDIASANAAKSLRSRLNNLGSVPDPLIVLDVAKIAAAKTAKGAIEFAQWSADMVKEFGEKVRPFLKAGWDQREQHLDAEVKSSTRSSKTPKKTTSEIRESVRIKSLERAIKQAQKELAGAERRGKLLGPNSEVVTKAKAKLEGLRSQLDAQRKADSLKQEEAKLQAISNSIKRIESDLAGRKQAGEKLGPQSQEVTQALDKLKGLREQSAAKRAADPETIRAKVEAAEEAVEKAIIKLDEQLQAGDISVKRTPSVVGSQRLEDLRMQRDAMNRLRAELRAQTRPKADPIEVQTKARITALANRTAKLQARTAAGDFSPQKKTPLDLSKNPEWVKLKAENDAAKTAYEKARYEARKAQRTTEQKIRDTVADVWAASRPILASTDISAPGRQGIFFSLPDLFTNPMRLGRQLKTMFRSQFSETKFQQNEAAIKSRENADLYESSDLYLADIDHKPSAREEQFKSELAEKIPGIGRIVRGSSRGFSAFMNTVRADAMDAFVKWSGGKENLDPATAKYLAAAINDLSGRGNVSSRQAQGALEWLAKYLFSPRLWVSRFNTATLKPIWRDPLNRAISPRARAVVAGQYVKFAGALLALKFLGEMAGAKMEMDPRDSDFGKLQVGSKRYDVMGGIGNMITLLARIATQKTKDDAGRIVRIAWKGEKRPERELGQILFNHLRNKAAPIPGAIYDYIYGRHPDRSKVTPTSMLKQTTVPITVSDTVGYFQNDNPASALRDTLLNASGVSVQDYRK